MDLIKDKVYKYLYNNDTYIFKFYGSNLAKYICNNKFNTSLWKFWTKEEHFQEVTNEEIDWLNACISANKFVEKPKCKFIVNKWYKTEYSNKRYIKFKKLENSGNYNKIYFLELIEDGKHEYSNDYWANTELEDSLELLTDLSEIQQYLPLDHVDKVREFKIGDWIYAEKQGRNYDYRNSKYIPIFQVEDINSCDKFPTWLRPVLGESTGIDSKYCRLASQSEIDSVNPKKEFILPEKWYIEITDENKQISNDWKIKQRFNDSLFKYDYLYVNYDGGGSSRKQDDGIEITFDQFKQYVLKEQPMEKWSVGSWVVALKDEAYSIGSFNKGCIAKITKINSIHWGNNDNWTCNQRSEDEGCVKWFATKQEAEEFAKTLLQPTNQLSTPRKNTDCSSDIQLSYIEDAMTTIPKLNAEHYNDPRVFDFGIKVKEVKTIDLKIKKSKPIQFEQQVISSDLKFSKVKLIIKN